MRVCAHVLNAAKRRQAYARSVRPLEEHYSFPFFFSPVLSATDIEAKPFVLLLGQYSVGKTTFVNALLDAPSGYPGAMVGPEPTTDSFVAIMHGEHERLLPGNTAAACGDLPFQALQQKFGNSFLSRFRCVEMPSEVLKGVTLVDTPGVLAGEKQRIERNYDMTRVTEWFAERSDIILLLFDANKLDISDELKEILAHLHGHDDKLRIVLNKCDTMTTKELMRVHGALMWALSRVLKSPEVVRVYINVGHFQGAAPTPHPPPSTLPPAPDVAALFETERQELYSELRRMPSMAAVRRINEVIRRARLALAHALVCATLRNMMPSLWGRHPFSKVPLYMPLCCAFGRALTFSECLTLDTF